MKTQTMDQLVYCYNFEMSEDMTSVSEWCTDNRMLANAS